MSSYKKLFAPRTKDEPPKPDVRDKLVPEEPLDPVPVPETILGSYATCSFCHSYLDNDIDPCPRCCPDEYNKVRA